MTDTTEDKGIDYAAFPATEGLRDEQRIAELEQQLATEKQYNMNNAMERDSLREQLQETIRLSAEKHRPAYDEQQRVIMELRSQLQAARDAGMVLIEAAWEADRACELSESITGEMLTALEKALAAGQEES